MQAISEQTTLQSRIIKTEDVYWKQLQFIQQEGFKDFPPEARQKLRQSILSNNFTQPFYVWQSPDGIIYCLDGYHRIKELKELASEGVEVPEKLPATFIECESKQEAAKLVLVFSSIYARITETGLFNFVDQYDMDWNIIKEMVDIPSIDPVEVESLFNPSRTEDVEKIIAQSLAEKFIIPPFSIFDTRQGYWQDRKHKWNMLFDSQESREEIELIAKSGQGTAIYELRNKMREKLGREPEWDEIIAYAKQKGLHIYEGASIFDPVLAEILYTWFCPKKADIIDPFAGGSVRGIVAGILGHNYLGIDLRQDQVDANIKQWKELPATVDKLNVQWMTGDSNNLDRMIQEDIMFDFVFSCPPYHDLEKYSDDPADLSNMTYDQFIEVYRSVISKSVSKLKNNRFATFVVGEIRDKYGSYKNFVADTIKAFIDAGMQYYNEIVLINVAGSLPIRIGRQFGNYRKVGKMHQNILVFYKGDPKKIKEDFPEINIEKIEAEHSDVKEYQPNIALSIID